MEIAQIILGAIILVLSVVTIFCVCAQQGNSHGLGAMAGGSDTDTFFGKNRSKDKNAILAKITIVVAIILGLAIIALDIIAMIG